MDIVYIMYMNSCPQNTFASRAQDCAAAAERGLGLPVAEASRASAARGARQSRRRFDACNLSGRQEGQVLQVNEDIAAWTKAVRRRR